jgi:hypothetical protein
VLLVDDGRGVESGDRKLDCYHSSLPRRSGLLHDILGASDLALNLFPSPAGSLDRAGLEFAVRTSLLDESSEPILTERFDQLAIRIRISKITGRSVSPTRGRTGLGMVGSYPMTPMEARIKGSLRLVSLAMELSKVKILVTYGCRTWAV